MNYYLATAPSDFDLGLLTRHQILETENLASEIGRQGALRAKVLAPNGKTLNIFVAHLDPASSETRLCESEPVIHFDNSAWNTELYRRFGIILRDQQIRPVTWQGQTEIRPTEMSGNLDLMPDTWYNLLLALGKNGDMKVLVWDPTKPTSMLQYR